MLAKNNNFESLKMCPKQLTTLVCPVMDATRQIKTENHAVEEMSQLPAKTQIQTDTDGESENDGGMPHFKFNCQSTIQVEGERKGHKLKLSDTELNF